MKKRGLIIDGQEIFTDYDFTVKNKYSGEILATISMA